MKSVSRQFPIRPARQGIMKTEALLAMFLLVGAMGIASSLIHRVNHLWSDSRSYQFAINELSNQMHEVVRLSPEEAEETLDTISVSDACQETLRESKLTGVLAEDELGSRVTLQLTWKDRGDAIPVVLSAWLKSDAQDRESSQ